MSEFDNQVLDRNFAPDPSKYSNQPIAIKYGAIWGGAGFLMTILAYLANMDPSMPDTDTTAKIILSAAGIGIAVWAISTAIKTDRSQLGGYISLGRCTLLGLKTGVVSGIISAVTNFLYMTVINPGQQESMREAIIAQYEEQGMSEEEIEMAMSMVSGFSSPAVVSLLAIVGGLIFGVLLGLIIGLFMQKDPYAK